MRRRRPVVAAVAIVFSLCAGALPARSSSPYEVTGPPAAAPARARLPLPPNIGEKSPFSAAWLRLQEDAAELGLLPGDIPPERVLDPLEETLPWAGRDPVAASLQTAERHPSLTALDPGQLELVHVGETARITFVHFRQTVEGLPVIGSKVTFGWDKTGRMRLAGARVFSPTPHDPWKDDPQPLAAAHWVSPDEAKAVALAGFPPGVDARRWEQSERAWLPVADSAAAVEPAARPWFSRPAIGLRPVWQFRFRTAEPDGWWEARVDGRTGLLLERRSLVRDVQSGDPGVLLQGRVAGRIEPMTAGDEEERPFPHLSLEFRQSGRTVLGTTDADGRFAFDARTPGSCALQASLSGPYVRVAVGSRQGETPAMGLRAEAPAETTLVWQHPISRQARDAFYHANVAHDVVRARDDGPALNALDRKIDLVVDSPAGPLFRCNAWWDGEALYFYEASDFCISFARIAGVVYHEYGHALTQYLCGAFGSPPYLDEGWSDYFAASTMNDPRIGLGFVGPNTYFREIETDRIWPDDAHWDPHYQGLIIASTLWDLRRVLGPSLTDSLFHFACYGAAQTHEEYLLDMLAWDDDDGQIENGTPHFEGIVSTFRAHGVGDEGVYLAFDPPPDPEEGPEFLEVRASIRSPLYALAPEASGLYVRVGSSGEFSRLPLERSGHTQNYLARIPLPAAGDTVNYYWSAANLEGATASLPSDAPASTYSFRVRRDAKPPEVRHRAAASALEGGAGHWIRVFVADNSGRIGPVVCRYRVDPGGEERETALAPIGRDGLYATEIPIGTPALGQEIRYAITAWDRAMPPNATVLPANGLFQVPVRAGWGFDLEASGGPFTASGDWTWGEPDDSALAFSGVRCWSTGLRGDYGADISSSLVWGPVDLRSFDRACLRLRHFYQTEAGHDGGRVELADDPRLEWTPLTPAGGYPAAGTDALGPCYSGRSDDYEEAVFPLDGILGRRAWFRFRFESDGQGGDRGWFLDDIRLMREQARVEPAAFDAATGQDEKVRLLWRAPAGVDTTSTRFAGYHLYRTVAQAQFGALPHRLLPPQTTAWTDREVVNGISYRYRLHAVYDEGESPGLLREATPGSGTMTLSVSQVGLAIREHAPQDTSVTLGNIGRGELLYQVYVGREAASLAEVRAIYIVRPAERSDWTTILSDPNDAGQTPDLRSVEARQRADSSGRMLEFALWGQEAWGDASGWGGVLLIDTDGDLTTSIGGPGPGWEAGGNIGAEAYILFGKLAREAEGREVAAVLVFGEERDRVILRDADLHAAADRIKLAVPLRLLGDPERVQVAVMLGRALAESPFDEGPDPPVPWLRREPRGGLVPPSATQELGLRIDASGLPNGVHRGCLILDSNDRTSGWRRLPFELRVDRDLPLDLALLEFRSLRTGLEGTFRLRPEVRPDSVFVERRDGEGWAAVRSWPAGPPPEGRYVFLERLEHRAPPPVGREYRLRVVEGSRAHTYGPYAASWTYAPPAIEAPSLTSTEEGVRLLVDFPPALRPVRAVRLERRFDDEEFWAPLAVPVSDSSRFSLLDRWSGLRDTGPRPDRLCLYRFQVDAANEDSLSYGPYEVIFRPPLPARLELHPPRPTPFRDRLLLRLDLPETTPVRLEVFSLDGRRRAVLVQEEMPAGVHQIVWDGADNDRRALPAGVYWIRLTTDQGSRTGRALRRR